MSLVLRIGRWSLTLFEVAIDDDGEAASLTSTTETTTSRLGFTVDVPDHYDDD